MQPSWTSGDHLPPEVASALTGQCASLLQRLIAVERALGVREWWLLGRDVPEARQVAEVASLLAVARGELEKQVEAYKLMGFREVHREEVHGRDQVREVLLQIGEGPNLIQLLEPLCAESPVEKTVERNGGRPGVAHVAFRVENAARAYAALAAKGFRMIDAAPRPGSRGTTVFFVHPKSREDAPFGILLEMVEDGRGRGNEGTRERGDEGSGIRG